MLNFRFLALFSAFFLLCQQALCAGCCLEEIALDVHYLTYNTRHFWNKEGKRRPSHNDFRQKEVGLCLEYMPEPDDILAVKVAYDHIEESLEGNSNGFTDVEAIWAHALFPIKCGRLWSKLTAIIPSGKEKHSLRYGRFGAELDLIYSGVYSLCGRDLYYLCGLGYRFYSGFPSDQLRAQVDILYNLRSNWYIWCKGDLQYGVFNGKRREHFNQILYNANYRLLKLEARLVGYLSDWFYVDAGYFEFVWGENVGTGGGFIGGFGFVY